MKLFKTLILSLLLLIKTGTMGFGQSLEKGMQAIQAGDFESAFKELEPLAKKGDQWAQYTLGNMYFDGDGVTQNYKQAYNWYMQSAKQGNEYAQFFIGYMYKQGNGIEKDETKSFKWFQQAALSNHPGAQSALGYIFLHGEKNIPQDFILSRKWFKSAAEQGYPGAALNLGYMYSQGVGFAQDNLKAFMWYSIAISNGQKEVEDRLIKIKLKMTSREISKATKMVSECKASNYLVCGWEETEVSNNKTNICLDNDIKMDVCKEASRLRDLMAPDLPQIISKRLMFKSIASVKNSLITNAMFLYNRKFLEETVRAGGRTIESIIEQMSISTKNAVCSNTDTKEFMKYGGKRVMNYSFDDGEIFTSIIIDNCEL